MESKPEPPPKPPPDEASLGETQGLLANVKRDEQARDKLFDRHRDELRRFASRRIPASQRGRIDPEDVLQVALLRAFKNIERFRYEGKGSFERYLRTIIARSAGEAARAGGEGAKHRESLPDESCYAPASREPAPLEELEGREALERLEAILAGFKDKIRDAIVQKVELHLPLEEIARQCGYPTPAAAGVAIQRALERLRRLSGN